MSSRRADVKVKLQHEGERENECARERKRVREIESLVQSAAVSCIRTEISFEALERDRDIRRTQTPTIALGFLTHISISINC